MSLHRHNNNASDRRESNSKLRAALRSAVQVALALSIAPLAYSQSDSLYELAIEPKRIDAALKEFAEQTGLQVLVLSEHAGDIVAPRVAGRLTDSEALSRLLRDTGLVYEKIDDRTIAVRPAAAAKFEKTSYSASPSSSRFKVAQAESVVGQDVQNDSQQGADDTARSANVQKLEEVVVTGSYIRGVELSASPMITVSREEIERSGYTTVQEVIRDLPQNLNSINERTNDTFVPTGGFSGSQSNFSAGANLRGLGGDSTLVLLNGRRLARTGRDTHVDLSLIPVSAIERVEVLTDGASALYGSDAVGGVINMITRKNFNGAEARVSYGSAESSSHSRRQAAALLGRSWGSGQFMLSYEQGKETPLHMWERFDDIYAVNRETALIQESERKNAVLYAEQKLSETITLDAEITHGTRDTPAVMSYDMGFFAGFFRMGVRNESTGAGLGVTADMPGGWQLRASAAYDQTEGNFVQWFGNTRESLELAHINDTAGDVTTLNVTADGSLFAVPGGLVRVALGAEGRRENWHLDTGSPEWGLFSRDSERDVKAVFAEINVPIIGESNRKVAARSLELSLAGRYEDYSDFGSTFNPKLGLAWVPLDGLKLRGTVGTSFKAPTLSQVVAQTVNAVYLGSYSDADGPTNILYVSGVVPGLQPEESENWSVGFDYTPAWSSALQLSVTLFGIDYDKRIGTPFPDGYSPGSALADPTYGFLVASDPALTDLQALIDRSDTPATCYEELPDGLALCDAQERLGSVRYILDTRTRNLASVRQRGVDFSTNYSVDSTVGAWTLQLSGAKLLDSTKVFIPGGTEHEQMNQAFLPVDLRLRAALGLANDAGWSVHTSVRYVDGYKDTAYRYADPQFPRRPDVASWTTVDVSAQWDLNRWIGLQGMQGLILQLNANNVLDREPPYVANPYGINYDPINADATGRFVSIQLKANW